MTAIKFKLLSRAPAFTLGFRAALAGAAFLAAVRFGMGGLAALLFVAANIVLYRSRSSGAPSSLAGFAVLLYLALRGGGLLAESGASLIGLLAAAVIFSFVFFLLAGIRHLFFVFRSRAYGAAALILSYGLFLLFFLGDKFAHFFRETLLLAGFLSLLSLELLRLSLAGSGGAPRTRAGFAASSAWLLLAFAWAVALLPFTALEQAGALAIFTLVIGEFLVRGLSGALDARFALVRVTWAILLFLSLAVAVSGAWGAS